MLANLGMTEQTRLSSSPTYSQHYSVPQKQYFEPLDSRRSSLVSLTDLASELEMQYSPGFWADSYTRWTTVLRVFCMMLTAMQTVLFAFSMFLLIVSHIEKIVVWNLVQELLDATFYLFGIIFCWLQIYSTFNNLTKQTQKYLARIAVVGIFIVGVIEILLVFFPFIPGIDTAPQIPFDIYSKWYQSVELTEVIIMPVVFKAVLFGGTTIAGVGRVIVMRNNERRGSERL